MKKLKILAAVFAIVGIGLAPVAMAETASAINPLDSACSDPKNSGNAI